MPLLEIRSVSHSYGKQPVLSDVTLLIERGRFVCLLGPSGSGKTTLLKIVAGLVTPLSGKIKILEQDQAPIPTHRRNIGFVFQSPNALFPHLNVFDNIAFPFRRGSRSAPSGNWKNDVLEMIHKVGLTDYATKSVVTLSGGQRQRVALARALVYRPSLLLLDEPLSSLDNRLKGQLLELMHELHELSQATFVYVTHDEREALRVATDIAILDEGRVQQFGPIDDVVATPASKRVAEMLSGWAVIQAQRDTTRGDDGIFLLPGNVPVNFTDTDGSRNGWHSLLNIALREDALRVFANSRSLPDAVDVALGELMNIRLPCTIRDIRGIGSDKLATCRLANVAQ